MRRVAVTALLVLAACGGSSDEADDSTSSAATTSTTTADPDGDDALFTERDDEVVTGDDAATSSSPPSDEASADGTSPTTIDEPTDDGDTTSSDAGGVDDAADGSSAGSTGGESGDDGGASSGATDGSGTDGPGTDEGSTGGGSSGDTGSTGGADGGSGDDAATTGGSTGGGDGGVSDAADLDRSILLDAAELEALGLGTDWFVEVVLEPAVDDGDAPCGLDRLASVDQLYAPAEDADGREFEQLLVPTLGADGVTIVRGLPECAEVTEQLGAGGIVEELQLADAAAAVVFSIDDDELGEGISWYAADVDGLLVYAFHIGEPELRTVVEAAFGQLVADVAAGT